MYPGQLLGDIGVTLTGGPVIGGGTPGLSLGPGIELSNANHISQLGGPFAEGGGAAALLFGGYANGFIGRDSCGNTIAGGLVGPAGGIGVFGQAGPTYTVPLSINLPSVVSTIGDELGEAFNALNPFS